MNQVGHFWSVRRTGFSDPKAHPIDLEKPLAGRQSIGFFDIKVPIALAPECFLSTG